MFEINIDKKDDTVTARTIYDGKEWTKSFVLKDNDRKNKQLRKAIISACLARLSVEECKKQGLIKDDRDMGKDHDKIKKIWQEVLDITKVIDNSEI